MRAIPQSVLEEAFLALIARFGLPPFEVQWRPPWHDGCSGIRDFARPAERVIIETDGRSWHAILNAQVEDRRRDREAIRHDHITLRYTYAEVVHQAKSTAGEIMAILHQRAARAA